MKVPDRSKISSITMLVLFAAAIIFTLFFYLGNVVPGTEGTPVEEPLVTDELIILSYIFFGIALFITMLFLVFKLIRNPKSTKILIISLIVFLSILGLSYLISSGKPIPDFRNPDNVEQKLKLVDTGLKAVYLFLGLSVIGVIYTEISGMLKSNNRIKL